MVSVQDTRYKLVSILWIHFVFAGFMLIYTIAGAYLFVLIEGSNWSNFIGRLWLWRDQRLHQLWQSARDINMTHDEWRNLFLENFMGNVTSRRNSCFICTWSDRQQCEYPWRFNNAIRYCSSLYLTIGYGDILPYTRFGRIVTVAYAWFGIFVILYALNLYGGLLASFLQKLWTYINRFYYTGIYYKRREVSLSPIIVMQNINWIVKALTVAGGSRPKPFNSKQWSSPADKKSREKIRSARQPDYEVNLPIAVAVFVVILYIMIGGVIIDKTVSVVSGWYTFESFFYLFNVLTTITFGNHTLDSAGLLLSHLWLFGGFVHLTMLFDVIQQRIEKAVTAPKTLKVKEVSGSEDQENPTWGQWLTDSIGKLNPLKRE